MRRRLSLVKAGKSRKKAEKSREKKQGHPRLSPRKIAHALPNALLIAAKVQQISGYLKKLKNFRIAG